METPVHKNSHVVVFINPTFEDFKTHPCHLCFLTEEINSYPSPELQEECENLDRGDIQQEASMTERLEIAYLTF